MVIAITVASHYSTRLSKLTGNDTIKVLATLFLLSYAKLLDLIITILTSTELVYPDGYHKRVWLYDGNVDYLKGKHIPLFIAAVLILVFLSIPYTAILFLIQWLQRLSNYKVLFFIGKLQPLIDAYTGPYKIKHRYWTGLLLLVRVCLYLVFSLNTLGDPMINLLATAITMFGLFAYLSMIGGIYKFWWLNLIEVIFILNLGILPTAVLYQNTTDSAIEPITYTSTGIAFVLFIVIVIYHLILKIINLKTLKMVIKSRKKRGGQKNNQLEINKPKIEVTTTTVELLEPLLEAPLSKDNESLL